jgi:hypothetical protein
MVSQSIRKKQTTTLTSDEGNSALEVEQGIADDSLVGWMAHDDGVLGEFTMRD